MVRVGGDWELGRGCMVVDPWLGEGFFYREKHLMGYGRGLGGCKMVIVADSCNLVECQGGRRELFTCSLTVEVGGG